MSVTDDVEGGRKFFFALRPMSGRCGEYYSNRNDDPATIRK